MECYVSLDDAKRHLNIDSWFEDEDALIEDLILVSQKAVENDIKYSLEETLNEYGQLDMPLKQAILLMVGQLYRNREVSSELTFKEVPKAYDYLLQPYRNYRYNH